MEEDLTVKIQRDVEDIFESAIKEIFNNSKNLDGEFVDFVNKYFWELMN